MTDPFADADEANRAKAAAELLERMRRVREAARLHLPLPAGGLFDECRRGEQDLWS